MYDLVVSASSGSSVCVWDITTGEKKLMFDRAHVTTLYNKEMVGLQTASYLILQGMSMF